MNSAAPIRYRKDLSVPQPVTVWPDGVLLVPFVERQSTAVHDLLVSAYATGFGTVPDYAAWWTGLVGDAEFHPDLCLVARADGGRIAGFCQCWTSGFIKDVAIDTEWRKRGLATALLSEAFGRIAAAGHTHADLKVHADNIGAIALYRRLGMIPVGV